MEIADSAQSRMDNVNMCNRKLGRSPGILRKCYLNLRGADPLLSSSFIMKLKIQDTEDAWSVTPFANTVLKFSGGYVSEIGNERGMRKAKYICALGKFVHPTSNSSECGVRPGWWGRDWQICLISMVGALGGGRGADGSRGWISLINKHRGNVK